jgi:hypothetical protein
MVSVFELGTGDCFDDTVETLSGQNATEVPLVDCELPHDNEIFFTYEMTDAVFPGTDAASESAGIRCVEEFETFVGRDFLESELDLFPITPTARSWGEGDRLVLCVLYALDLSKLEGTMEGSGR